MANSAHYQGVTDNVYNDLKSKLANLGIDLQGKSGRISQKGVSADYNYDDASQTLQISNVKVGFPASMMYNSEKIVQQISRAVQDAGGRVA
ncbi:hypothetical protein BH24BAC1_BH24BAC1_08960 [soil metagenome]